MIGYVKVQPSTQPEGVGHVRRALQAALPDVELIDIPAVLDADAPVVDVLAPLIATVDGRLMETTRPR